jgi:hypothetical protein
MKTSFKKIFTLIIILCSLNSYGIENEVKKEIHIINKFNNFSNYLYEASPSKQKSIDLLNKTGKESLEISMACYFVYNLSGTLKKDADPIFRDFFLDLVKNKMKDIPDSKKDAIFKPINDELLIYFVKMTDGKPNEARMYDKKTENFQRWMNGCYQVYFSYNKPN